MGFLQAFSPVLIGKIYIPSGTAQQDTLDYRIPLFGTDGKIIFHFFSGQSVEQIPRRITETEKGSTVFIH